jgi:hypothetical protein
MKAIGAAVPVAWPHDGNDRGDRNTGEPLAQQYKAHGLLMLPTHATWPDGGFSTEAGLMEWTSARRPAAEGRARTCRTGSRSGGSTTARTARS